MGDRTIALLLGLATAASRLPFAAARLWEWDSVLYARALEHGFHVDDSLAASRPHPPGYVFYVASAALAKSAGLDSDHALVAISVLASGLAAAALYLFCRRVIGAIPSALVALAFACDPLVWLHGEVAMPYVLLAPLSTIIAATFLHARGRGAPALAAASVLFGILCGFRQDLLLFLFPLWLWLVLPAGWTARGAALAGLVAGCLAWFVPSALLSDGALSYAASVYRQLSQVSGVSGGGERSLAVNAVLLLGSLAWALYAIGPVLVVLVLARALAWTRRRVTAGGPSLAPFFALWLLPPFLFYALV